MPDSDTVIPVGAVVPIIPQEDQPDGNAVAALFTARSAGPVLCDEVMYRSGLHGGSWRWH